MKRLLLSILVVTLLTNPALVSAQTNSGKDSFKDKIESSREELRNRAESRFHELKDKIASRSSAIKQRLEATKLKVCQTRQEILKKRSTSLAEKAEKQFKVFGSIASRVEKFYTEKVLSQGTQVASYQALVDDIQTQKESAQASISAAKLAADEFDCTSENPKGQLVDFKEKMKLSIEALKDYRTSIKNLIVSVKQAVSETKEASSSANN